MLWQEVRESYPSQWVVLEALAAHDVENKRIFEDISVVKAVDDSLVAHREYRELHRKYPEREFLFVSTQKEHLDVIVHRWVGIRGKP
jgi:hypothetical protein